MPRDRTPVLLRYLRRAGLCCLLYQGRKPRRLCGTWTRPEPEECVSDFYRTAHRQYVALLAHQLRGCDPAVHPESRRYQLRLGATHMGGDFDGNACVPQQR